VIETEDAGATAEPSLLTEIGRRAWVSPVAIVLLSFWAHAPSLQNGYIWDDPTWLLNNVHLRSLGGLYWLWTEVPAATEYYPLMQTTFWVENQLWGLSPFHFHLVNVLLHALSAVMLWRCLRMLVIPGAFFAACVFALHPVQVESVAWLSERNNVLCGFLYFSAAACLIDVLLPPNSGRARPWKARYGAGVALFAMAVLSKSVACALGPSLLVLAWWRNGKLRWRDLALTAPLFAIGALIAALTAWVERYQVVPDGDEWALTFADRCLIAGRAVVFYTHSLVWPGERIFMPARWSIDATAPLQFAYPVAVVFVFIALWLLRKRIGRGPFAAALIFVGTLFPVLGFFDLYAMRHAFAFDHFQYLATPAPIALCAAVIATEIARWETHLQGIAAIACALILASYGVLTWRQSHKYYDAETLWRHNVEHSPNQWLGYRQLGGIVLGQGKADEAVALFRRAAELRPSDEAAFNNLAIAYSYKGEFDAAIGALRESVRLRPAFAPTYRNLSIALSLAGRDIEARAMLDRYERMKRIHTRRMP
jgi:hypothetical protein